MMRYDESEDQNATAGGTSLTSAMDTTTYVKGILAGVGLTPRGIQSKAIEAGLLEGKSIMVCSPTGSGKTLVGEMALLRGVSDICKGIYLVPLRALATQVVSVLKERYADQGIRIEVSTGDFQTDGSDLAEAQILVTTYERADSLVRHKVDWLNKVGVLVIDEVQNIGHTSRGARLESVIMRMRKLTEDLQIVALSATVGEPYMLADWLGCHLVESDVRPVPLTCKLVPTTDREKTVQQLVMATVQADGQVIVFHRTRRETEAEANRLKDSVGRQLRTNERTTLDREMDSLENWNVTIPSEMRPLLHDGVAYHHAGLGARTRRLVETMFDRGLLRVVCATTTLAAGMDLPARTVVLTSARSPQHHKRFLPANQVHQMLGRAGRPGKDVRGFGVILTGSQGEVKMLTKEYFTNEVSLDTGKIVLTPKYEPVTSELGTSNSLTEQLLVALDFLGEASLEEVEQEYLGESYLFHCGRWLTNTPMRIVQLGEVTAQAAIERHANPNMVRSARENILGTVKIRERGDTVIGGIVSVLRSGQQTCRFSARMTSDGTLEGPMCSCGSPMNKHGFLCNHLVALGMAASSEMIQLANYVIPLALSETSPSGLLIRLGLLEGGEGGKLRPTTLGRTVNRLYLKITTFKEMMALIPTIGSNTVLMSVLRHLVSLETGQKQGETFEALIGSVASTNLSMREMARMTNLAVGDIKALLDKSRLLLYSIVAVADRGNMERVSEMVQDLLSIIDSRLHHMESENNDSN